MKKK
ncbi:hypothetical protein SOVF_183000, partial [Spinacia oleracea]|jgi:hypothetical protein